jgi:C1A family cysteine protease
MAPTIIPGFGWRPSLPDLNDYQFSSFVNVGAITVPRMVEHRDLLLDAWQQGGLGSCTAHSTSAAYMAAARLQGFYDLPPSRLFVYYMTRYVEGTISSDSGASNRNAMKALAKYGAPMESLWPYVEAKFKTKPPARVTAAGSQRQAVEYLSVRADQLQQALAGGYPVVIGFSCYTSLMAPETARTGLVPLPRAGEKQVGGHSVLLTGYNLDHPSHIYSFRNSWGMWGDKGYGRLPAAYLHNAKLAGDFWTLRKVEG